MQALRVIGYDVRDSTAAIIAFQRKYLQAENNKELSDAARKVLYTLLQQCQ
jgi:N-acetylmuramoyl-L-alanine amidase